MVLNGYELLSRALDLAGDVRERIEKIDGMHVNGREDFCGPGKAAEFDPLPVIIDISELATNGYRAADWLRTHHQIDMHIVDHRRISAQFTHADDESTAGRLLEALRDLSRQAHTLGPAPVVELPGPDELRPDQVCLPREAYFAATEDVPVEKAVGRVAAEMMTPYPPGIPTVLPGERLTEPPLRYLRSGIEAGMNVPDPADPTLRTVRVRADGSGPGT